MITWFFVVFGGKNGSKYLLGRYLDPLGTVTFVLSNYNNGGFLLLYLLKTKPKRVLVPSKKTPPPHFVGLATPESCQGLANGCGIKTMGGRDIDFNDHGTKTSTHPGCPICFLLTRNN